ncbi:MAG TPA: YeeE/YedE thiosulfate transporter family protein [Casimicrobiaceae bacterium]
MPILLTSAAFLAAAICAGLMGFAIQRGATCTVAAVDEVMTRRRAHRLLAMVEASLWVACGLVIAQALHLLPAMPVGYALDFGTIVGGVLLGLGAYVNGACVFGAIARLGSGELAYLATPVGFYVGCLTVGPLFAPAGATQLDHGSPVLHASPWVAAVFVAPMLYRVVNLLRSPPAEDAGTASGERARSPIIGRAWSPHSATALIGITFLFTLLLVGGTWAYTDVLAELARGMAGSLPARFALLLALFAGAVGGGVAAGRFRRTPPRVAQVAKCAAGGALMAWGSLLIPGSNDGLILVGMPLLRPYAWVAFLTMCVSIAAAMLLRRALRAGAGRRGMLEG